MTIARALRWLLAMASLLIAAWSFFDVGVRIIRQQTAEHGAITLTLLHWGAKDEDSIVESLAQAYMKEHPGVRIVRINGGDGGGMTSKLKTMIAAGDAPDLFYLSPDLMPELANLKLIQPIDEYVNREIAAGNRAWFDDYYPILIKAYRYDAETGRTGEGPLYGLPKDFTTAVFYVNLDLFAKAGIRVPYEGWTWNEFEVAARKITELNSNSEYSGRRIYGAHFDIWPDTLRQVLWTYGGDFFGGDFRDVTLDEPAAQEAIKMIARMRLEDRTAFNATGIAKNGGQEFFTGNIGMVGPLGRWMTPRFKDITAFKWDIVPVPYQSKEFQSSQIFLTAWTMSSRTKHPDAAFQLMKFLCGGEGAIQQSRLGLAIPPLKSVANSDDFLSPDGLPPHHAQLFLDAISYARIQQNPREAEWTRIVGDRIGKSIQLGQATPMESAREIENAWQAELDSPLRRQQWHPMNWNWIVSITAAIAVTLVAALWWKARREKLGPLDRAQERAGWTFIAPWVIGFLALTLGPMIASLLLSFTKWSAMSPISSAESVGLANFQQLITADTAFYQSLKVTLYFVVLAVPIGQISALAVALLMNSRVRWIETFRTIYFVPSIVSGAVLAVMWIQIFNNDYGIFNRILAPIADWFGTTPPDWFGKDVKRWGIPAFVIMGLWGVGGGMIIYLAGLKGIPMSLYEAATIDGAGPLRRLWNVTLPMLSPLIFYNVVMAIIGSFQVFTQAYMMTGAGPDNATLFYVLNLYRQAFEFHNMGYASAMAWILFLIVLGLTILVFRGSRRLVYYEGLRS
jgi:multiple sugar transport system permease protein